MQSELVVLPGGLLTGVKRRRRPFRYGTVDIANVLGLSVRKVRSLRSGGLDLGYVKVLAEEIRKQERARVFGELKVSLRAVGIAVGK